MSSYFSRLWQTFRFVSKRKLVGKDLLGNSFYETITGTDINGTPRMRRTVQYINSKNDREAWRAAENMHSLPVQWTSWLSYSRNHPPTIEELQTDQARQHTLAQNVARLKAQDETERRRQLEAWEQDQLSVISSTHVQPASEPDLEHTLKPRSEADLEAEQTHLSSQAVQKASEAPEAPPSKPIGPTAEPQTWVPSLAQRSANSRPFPHT